MATAAVRLDQHVRSYFGDVYAACDGIGKSFGYDVSALNR